MEFGRSPLFLTWQRFKNHKIGMVSLIFLICLTVVVILAPLIEFYFGLNVEVIDLFSRFEISSFKHPLGTDELGRDILIRLIYGGRVSLFVGIVSAIVAAVFGAIVGLTAGYFGGVWDAMLMRITDSVIALPVLPLLIVLAAVDLSKIGITNDFLSNYNISIFRIIIIISIVGWTTVARLVRASTLALRDAEFVRAARALGASSGRIIFIHILPNLSSPIIVATTLSAGNIILLESVLSFLGLGIQPPTPSWGNLLTNAQELIWEAPTLAFYPGIMIFVTVIAFNFLGDGLQDSIDPRARKTDLSYE